MNEERGGKFQKKIPEEQIIKKATHKPLENNTSVTRNQHGAVMNKSCFVNLFSCLVG